MTVIGFLTSIRNLPPQENSRYTEPLRVMEIEGANVFLPNGLEVGAKVGDKIQAECSTRHKSGKSATLWAHSVISLAAAVNGNGNGHG